MAVQVFRGGDSSDGVKALQRALKGQAERRLSQPLQTDSHFGPATMRAFRAFGCALGFEERVLLALEISTGAQALIANPEARGPGLLPLQRARSSLL